MTLDIAEALGWTAAMLAVLATVLVALAILGLQMAIQIMLFYSEHPQVSDWISQWMP